MKIHEKYMLRCIQLAKNGLGNTYPNPLVGSVIVHNDTIIGEGWHQKAGLPHAEVRAVQAVKDEALLSNATIYVNLEPCSHFGKTPPCADLIISKGIKKVVIGTTDPNPKVAGNGIKKLLDAGCDVVVGILEKECEALNKRFFTFQNKKRPFIILKWAETADGFIAPDTKEKQAPVWISNAYSRQLAHKLRAQEQAILVGTQTVVDDNPSLTTRDWAGNTPIRVVLDKNQRTAATCNVYTAEAPTYLISEATEAHAANATLLNVNFSRPLGRQLSDLMFSKNVQSMIVEGGAQTLQTFIEAKLWDEAFVFKGNSVFGTGIPAPKITASLISEQPIGNDSLLHYKNPSN